MKTTTPNQRASRRREARSFQSDGIGLSWLRWSFSGKGGNNAVACVWAHGYVFKDMKGLRYVYWQDDNFWLGYLEEYPDYMTQGESLEDLQEHLRDLYAVLSGGLIPAARRVAELEVQLHSHRSFPPAK